MQISQYLFILKNFKSHRNSPTLKSEIKDLNVHWSTDEFVRWHCFHSILELQIMIHFASLHTLNSCYWHAVLYCMVLYRIASYCIKLYCIVLYCITSIDLQRGQIHSRQRRDCYCLPKRGKGQLLHCWCQRECSIQRLQQHQGKRGEIISAQVNWSRLLGVVVVAVVVVVNIVVVLSLSECLNFITSTAI